MDTIRPRNLVLFYDSETTGFPLFKEPSDDPRQPHLVQLGAILVDVDTREELEVVDLIIRPADWTIPDEAAAVHGITTERALAEGVPEAEALQELLRLWGAGETTPVLRVAHNEQFDARIIRIGMKRFFGEAFDGAHSALADCRACLKVYFAALDHQAQRAAA